MDALRPDHIGAYGYSRPTTPNIDRFAMDSTVFESAFAQASFTSASIASLFTSSYPPRHGVETAFPQHKLSPRLTTLAEVLASSGFATAAFSSHTLVSPEFGFDQGFSVFDTSNAEDVNTDPALKYKLAAEWIKAQGDNPFFCYIHVVPPHNPYNPPTKYLKDFVDARYEGDVVGSNSDIYTRPYSRGMSRADREQLMNLYDAHIRFGDDDFGEFLVELQTLGVYDDLTLVLLSDHGEAFGEHGVYGHGTTTFNEMIHVPLIVKLPKGRARPAKNAGLVELVDLAPSLLELAGLAPSVMAPQGRSFREAFETPEFAGKSYIFSQAGDGMSAGGESCFDGRPFMYTVRSRDFSFVALQNPLFTSMYPDRRLPKEAAIPGMLRGRLILDLHVPFDAQELEISIGTSPPRVRREVWDGPGVRAVTLPADIPVTLRFARAETPAPEQNPVYEVSSLVTNLTHIQNGERKSFCEPHSSPRVPLLFELGNDPAEKQNVGDTYPALVERFWTLLERYRALASRTDETELPTLRKEDIDRLRSLGYVR